MTSPCTKEAAIDFLVENAKDTKKQLDKLVEISIDNAVIHETLNNQSEKLDKIDERLTIVEKRPAKIFKWALTVMTPVMSAVIIYYFVG